MKRWRNCARSGAAGPSRLVRLHTILIAFSCAEARFILVGDHTPQEKGDEGESDEETHADKQTPPEERFLQKDSDGLWVLGPLPDLGTVRNTDLSTAFHVYVTQQWSMAASILLLNFC